MKAAFRVFARQERGMRPDRFWDDRRAEGERAVLLRDAEAEQPEAHGERARLPQWMRVAIWLNIGVLWTLLFAFLF